MTNMKTIKSAFWIIPAAALVLSAFNLSADDSAREKPRAYLLKKCIVSGDKFDPDLGGPYVYIYKDKKVKGDVGREIKFCCKDCLKDFNKDPQGYLKKIDEAEAKLKK